MKKIILFVVTLVTANVLISCNNSNNQSKPYVQHELTEQDKLYIDQELAKEEQRLEERKAADLLAIELDQLGYIHHAINKPIFYHTEKTLENILEEKKEELRRRKAQEFYDEYKFSNYNQIESNTFVCDGSEAYAYHSNINCEGLNNCQGSIYATTQKDAIQIGRIACELCYY